MTRKAGLGSLLLLDAAAFWAYKYSKMNNKQKKDLLDKGKRLVNDNLGAIKNRFGGQNAPQAPMNTGI